MKLNYYGPINKQGVIKKVVATTYSDEALTARQSSIVVEPDPLTAKPGDSIGFIETFEDF
jgi:plastocyanin